MAIIKNTDLFVPELVADSVQGYVAAGVVALFGTGAARIETGMPDGKTRVGDSVKVPYFGSLGEMEDIATDGDALTPKAFAQTNESATVTHSGIAIEITKRIASNSDDPSGELARLMVESLRRRADKALIDAAASATGWGSYTVDVTGTSENISYDLVVDGMNTLGDEAGDWAALCVHSATLKHMYKERDADGRPLLSPNAFEGRLPTYFGLPVIQSDRLPVATGDYTSLLLKRDSLVFWLSEISDSDLQMDKDILRNTDVAALHAYWAAHRYSRMAGQSKPGVVRLLHKAP